MQYTKVPNSTTHYMGKPWQMLQAAYIKTCNLPAFSATVKVFQLISTAAEPALAKGTQIQMLDEINQEARKCPQDRLTGWLQCMAEAVGMHQNSGLEVRFPA